MNRKRKKTRKIKGKRGRGVERKSGETGKGRRKREAEHGKGNQKGRNFGEEDFCRNSRANLGQL